MNTQCWTQIKAMFGNKNFTTIFTSGPNRKLLLYGNKTKLLPSRYPGVYELKCTCKSAYFGETKKKRLTRTINGTILEQQNTL